MGRPAEATVLLDLPDVPGRAALRAGLMAMRIAPTALPTDRRGRETVLQGLAERPHAVAFVDISQADATSVPTLLQLDAALPRDAMRGRIVLTRLAAVAGHVGDADRRWVQQLGFADLVPEFDALDCEGGLRRALEVVARAADTDAPSPAELARFVRVMDERRDDRSPRAALRRRAGQSAEALAGILARSLVIRDRTWRLQNFPQCFVGSEAVAWMARHFQCTPAEAVAAGQALMSLGLMMHVAHAHPFLDDKLFYRLAVSEAADRVDPGDVLRMLTAADGPPVADRTHLGKTCARCWVGSEAVDRVVARFGILRHDAWVLLHRLMQFGLIAHVVRARPFIDGHFYFFYRFTGLTGAEDRT